MEDTGKMALDFFVRHFPKNLPPISLIHPFFISFSFFMQIEMMSEAIDETLDKDEAEEETEELTNQVLDEIGVDIASQLSLAPKGRIASKNAALLVNVKSEPTTDVDDLKKRLASLRRL
ncbi:hypothetical protein E1A91_A09G156500v1 [Gossypium mustelinum]|uniref:Vacuolar protein sorting-associated protein 2 homolog 2 isoform X1 n=2 Tax=Gossypium TaxID=3633 RepID=A0ABM2YQ39_GOSHI|nr:vacuolar protein sorting-associated protein 2 homolog 2-like isoform X1 [Gossypium hirsutum]TYJ18937.1 hypothetical protein E1A91_A09G156500v1 [Gossypium mustelinum]